MRPGGDHCHDLLGAYLLGACPAKEAEWVAEHLGLCDSCAREAGRLSNGSGALLADVAPVAPPAGVKERVMAQVQAEAELFEAAAVVPRTRRHAAPARSRRNPWPARLRSPLAVAALVCTLLLAVTSAAGLYGGLGSDDPSRSGSLAAQVDERQAPGASATLEIRDGEGRLRVRGLPGPGRDRIYQVWVRRAGEAPRPAEAEFSVSPAGTGQVRLPGELAGVDQVLVTSEPAGGSPRPTRNPVLRVDTSPA